MPSPLTPRPPTRLPFCVERRGAGEEDDAVLIRVRRLRALAARIGEVVQEERVERTGADLEDFRVDAGRIERLRAETDRAVRHGGAGRHAEVAVAAPLNQMTLRALATATSIEKTVASGMR